MSEYLNLGTRVVMKENHHNGAYYKGEEATIISFSYETYGLSFDVRNPRRHRCGRTVPAGYGWYAPRGNFKVIGESPPSPLSPLELRFKIRGVHLNQRSS